MITHDRRRGGSGQRIRLVTDKDVAEMLKISVRQLHRLKSRGDVIQPVKIGKLTRWNLKRGLASSDPGEALDEM